MSPVVRTLVILVAVIGFLFDTYELLMLPVIGAQALSDLMRVNDPTHPDVRAWIGKLLWMSALCGGIAGLFGGWMIDRFGRKRIMVASVLLYSFSPLCAAFSSELWQFVLFRCTTFIGVCVEMVAAVTWLAELFPEKRSREKAIAWSLAAASLGGLLVTLFDKWLGQIAGDLPAVPTWDGGSSHAGWRYTLISGLIPGAMILLLMPFVPESKVWSDKKKAGTLKRPSFGELFSPALVRTTIVTTILSACGYAAAFGALQVTPSQIILAHPDITGPRGKAAQIEKNAAATAEEKGDIPKLRKMAKETQDHYKSNIQLWQEIGGLTGRILLAVFVSFIPARRLIRLFLIPGVLLFPFTYWPDSGIITGEFNVFCVAIFFCGLLTVAQFSFLSEYLPKVFPVHLRGTGGSFATNVGGRMIGTMAATLNTAVLAPELGVGPLGVAKAAAVIGGSVYLIALVASLFLPEPKSEGV